MTGVRGAAHHCSICGAKHRNMATHMKGMTRAQHEAGSVDYTRTPLSATERVNHLDQRESWEGRMVTMPDKTRWKVLKHINGSLYQVTSNGKFRFASHPTETGEWKWWEDRPGSRTAAERVISGPHPSMSHASCVDEQDNSQSTTRQEAMDAMDEAVEDLVAQEDEAATMAPPTEDSDTIRLEVLGARLESEDGEMFVVFKVGPDYYSGRLDRYLAPEFDPLDLIRKPEDD